MGLPLERFRERRRAVLEAEREREEAEVRRRREEARKAAEEQAREEAVRLREQSIALAYEYLGDEEANRFMAEPLQCLSGQALAEIEGVLPGQVEQIMRALAAECRRLDTIRAKQRLAADCRGRLGKEVGRLLHPSEQIYGFIRPIQCCKDGVPGTWL
ncbi:hypothetical protein GCM10009099_39180 [Caenispirillum bisanense]